MTNPDTDAPPRTPEAGQFVLSAEPLPPNVHVALPRFENSTPEDALAAAAARGTNEAQRRLMESFSSFRFDYAATTTDDNRFALFEHSLPDAPTSDVTDTVVADLVRTYGCPVEVGCAQASSDPAWQSHDRLVVQLTGTSTWAVHEPSELSALPGYSDPTTSGPVVWQGTLAEGQAMYVPRGWPSATEEINDPEGLLIFTIERWTGLDILGQLVHTGGHWPLLRADAPVDIAAHTDAYDIHLYRENNFGDLLAELASIEHVDAALARLQVNVLPAEAPRAEQTDQSATVEVASASPAGLDPASVLQLRCPTGVKWIGSSESSVSVAVAGLMLELSMEALPAFAEVASGAPFRIADLPLTADSTGSATLVRELAALELIDIVIPRLPQP